MNLKKILKPNFIKAGLKSLTANILKDYKTPIGVYLTITSRCNLNCKCCDFQKINQKKILEIPTENCIEYIRQMADAGVVKLNITGGEPLLHKGIDEIIKFAKSKKMFIALSTNATKISEHLDALKFVDVVMMSFDGSPKNHNYLRGADNFETLIKTMELLKKNNINFWTTTTLNKKNINDIEFVLSIAKKYNTYANFVLIQFFDKVIESNSLPDYQKVQQLELIPDDKDIRAAFEKLIKLKKDGEPIGSSFEFLNFMKSWDDYKILMSSKNYGIKCVAGKLYCHLFADEKLYACGHCIGAIDGIDIKKSGFINGFNDLQKIPNCQSCRVACDTENNLIYNLNLKSIFNWLSKM